MSINTSMDPKTPGRLQRGDTVQASIRGTYVSWIVQETREQDGVQVVYASAPGRGSVRFTWGENNVKCGVGHGLRFYFARRPAVLEPAELSVWKHKNGTLYRVLFVTNVGHVSADHPPDVVYRTLHCPEHLWSRPLADWHRSFTEEKL